MTHKKGCALHDHPGLLGSAMGVGVFCTCWLSLSEPIREVMHKELGETAISSWPIRTHVPLYYVLPDEGQHKDSRNRGPAPREYRIVVATTSASSDTGFIKAL